MGATSERGFAALSEENETPSEFSDPGVSPQAAAERKTKNRPIPNAARRSIFFILFTPSTSFFFRRKVFRRKKNRALCYFLFLKAIAAATPRSATPAEMPTTLPQPLLSEFPPDPPEDVPLSESEVTGVLPASYLA